MPLALSEQDVAEARDLYLQRYADSKYWVDFSDFSFYRMDVVDVYYVGGFGVMGWVSASEYVSSRPDPLADSMADIMQHMNADHRDALVLLARKFAGLESQEATMTAVDRLGFHVRLKTNDGVRGTRIAFLREVTNPIEAREVLVEMVQAGARRRRSDKAALVNDHRRILKAGARPCYPRSNSLKEAVRLAADSQRTKYLEDVWRLAAFPQHFLHHRGR